MGNPTLAELADKVPALVKAGIRGLADDDRLGLAVALVEGGRMTFSEMRARYGLNPSTLSSHLNALQRGDLIRNYYEKNEGRVYSYYEATDLPKVMLSALFIAVRKMRVVEDRPVRARGYDPLANLPPFRAEFNTIPRGRAREYDPLANQGGTRGVPSWLPARGQAETQSQATVSVSARASVDRIFINAAEDAQHDDGIYRFGSKVAIVNRADAQGVQNE